MDTGVAGPLFDRAVAEGVLYVPGKYCYPAEGCPRPDNRLRLSFGCQSCEGLRRGVEALATGHSWCGRPGCTVQAGRPHHNLLTCALSTDTCCGSSRRRS